MEKKFDKERLNPIELIKSYWPNANTSHIIYDANMKKGEYEIIRQSGGDGTALFTIRMLQDALIHLINMESFFKPKLPENWDNIKAIKYTIGTMTHVTVFGMIYLKCSKTQKYPGLTERVRIPVISDLIYK